MRVMGLLPATSSVDMLIKTPYSTERRYVAKRRRRHHLASDSKMRVIGLLPATSSVDDRDTTLSSASTTRRRRPSLSELSSLLAPPVKVPKLLL
jgi:hypothetical protein